MSANAASAPIAEVQPRPLRILRIRAVRARTGLGRSTLYRAIQAGEFPEGVPLGPRSVGWVESEVEQWIAARIAERDSGR
jgi:prophage regulatory protein